MAKAKKLPKVPFPIKMIINERGRDEEKVIHIGDTFKCLMCGQTIYANSKSVFMVDDLPYITCTNIKYIDKNGIKHRCGYKAFAPYYIDQRSNGRM